MLDEFVPLLIRGYDAPDRCHRWPLHHHFKTPFGVRKIAQQLAVQETNDRETSRVFFSKPRKSDYLASKLNFSELSMTCAGAIRQPPKGERLIAFATAETNNVAVMRSGEDRCVERNKATNSGSWEREVLMRQVTESSESRLVLAKRRTWGIQNNI